jgi:hypothetical protein
MTSLVVDLVDPSLLYQINNEGSDGSTRSTTREVMGLPDQQRGK